tara:strand:- start:117 stop:338 length:222 start_codon:yes stop_codon:yes gene_type:complete
MDCEFNDIINNITKNCDNDMEVIKDTCKVICMSSIVKALNYCYFEMLDTGLIEQMRDVIKFCYYKKNENPDSH